MCSPTIIQHTVHHLSQEQLNFLNRGPSYVSPCQIHVLSKSSLTLADILSKQIAPLRRDLTKLFSKYHVDLSRRINFEREVQQLFHQCFIRILPESLQERALYEKQLIGSIRSSLKRDKLILRRTSDDQNTYYLGNLNDFNERTQNIVEESICYEYIGTMNDRRTKDYYMKDIIKTIDTRLEQLYEKKLINKENYDRFILRNRTNLKLPTLYFLPNVDHNNELILEPRFSSYYQSPIYVLAQYLDRILRPLYENYSRSTRFFDGGDFIEKLQNYILQRSNGITCRTHFGTFEIHDIYTNVSQSLLLRSLTTFLVNPLIYGRHEKLSNETIEQLVQLVVLNNYFIFEDKVYRIRRGCPLNLPLAELLVDIYLEDWQLTIIRHMRVDHSFYGRFHTRGFCLWNDPVENLLALFEQLQRTLDSDIRMIYRVHTSVHFLNAYIENKSSLLFTKVYHPLNSQSYVLPYASQHPRLVHRQWFRFALIRASQYCTTYEDFRDERIYLEITMLANGYSLDFIEYHLRQFYQRFNSNPNRILELNQFTYRSFRQQLFRRLKQDKNDFEQERKLRENRQLIQLHYHFDWGLRNEFNETFFQLWTSLLNQDPIFRKHGLQIRLTTEHCYTSNKLLARISSQS